MTLTVGPHTGLREPSTYTFDGNRLDLDGWVVGATFAECEALRQNFATLGRGQIEPIVSTVDAMMTGYWKMLTVSVSAAPGIYNNAFRFRYRLTAERLSNPQAVTHTARSISRERTGAGGVSEDPWLGLPSTVKWVDLSGGDTGAYYTRTGPGGSARVYVDASLANSVSQFQIDPADFYTMRPYIKVNGYEVTNDAVPSVGNGNDWELCNGFIRVRSASASTHTFRLAGPVPAAPSGYGTDYSVIVGIYLSGTRKILVPDHIQVREVTTEIVRIRLIGGVSTTGVNDNYRVTLDLALRRGSSYVECLSSSFVSAAHSVKDLAAAALTVVTAGKTVRSTANDADGNRLWIASGTTLNTTAVATGEVYSNAIGTQLPFGIGIELDGSSSVAPNTVAEQFDHYWADQTVTLEIG